MGRSVSLDQLGNDPDLITGPLHAPLEHEIDIELLADLSNVPDLTLELERRIPCRDLQLIELCQFVQQCVRKTVGEIFVLRVGAHIDEGQHGNRALRRDFRRIAGQIAVPDDDTQYYDEGADNQAIECLRPRVTAETSA